MSMRKIRKALALIYFYIYSRIAPAFLKLDDKAVVFLTDAHEKLDGNLKAISDYIDEEYADLKIKSFCRGDRRRAISFSEFRAVCRAMSSCKYIILDDFYGLTSSMKLRNGQKLVQLWHGSGAFKKFGYSRLDGDMSPRAVHSGYRKYTGALASSEGVRKCFAEAFNISVDKVRALGSPRSDILFDEDFKIVSKSKLISAFPELSGKKIILFAPTYRGERVEAANYDFNKLEPEQFIKEIEEEYRVLVRWHPALLANVKSGRVNFKLPEGMIDVSDYPDLNELIAASDILITDYSSIIFDWYITGRPVVFFMYDLEKYEGGRGLYFDLDEYLYGRLARNKDELVSAVRESNLCVEKRAAFGEKFMSACDGHSREKVSKWIFDDDERK